MLTRQQRETRQKQALDFIAGRLDATGGVSPSYDEIAEALCMKSKSSVSRVIDQLIQRGQLRRLSSGARALEVLDHARQTGTMIAATGKTAGRVPEMKLGNHEIYTVIRVDGEAKLVRRTT